MRKLSNKILASAFLFVFVLGVIFVPQQVSAGPWDIFTSLLSYSVGKGLDSILFPFGAMAQIVLIIANWFVWASGVLLNEVINFTVVGMSERLSVAPIEGAWKVIRDVANMSFIFVLLYAAIQTIIGQGKDTNRLIVRVVVVAVLINFSLFFTKVVIDISNVLALTFYDAIAPGVIASGDVDGGIANSLMELLHLQSVFEQTSYFTNGTETLMTGVVGTVLAVIASFVFFSISIMFIVRFVTLIFVLILSPIAFVAFILPQAEKYQQRWSDALWGQAFFAPVYFLLTWVVIYISRGLFSNDGNIATAVVGTPGASGGSEAGDITILMNFVIIIAMLMTSLSVAREVAGKAGSGVTKWAMGGAGALTLGLAGRLGRGTLGRAGAGIASSETVKNMIDKGGMSGAAGRLALMAGTKAAKGTWDLRGTGIGKELNAGKPVKAGGFMADEKARQKATAERTRDQKVTPEEKARLARRKEILVDEENKALARAGYRKSDELINAERELARAKTLEFGERETDMGVKERIALAQNEFDKTKALDIQEREYLARTDRNVANAVAAREEVEQAESTAAGRIERFANKQSQPTTTLPEFATNRSTILRRIDEKILRKGVGGALGEKATEIGTRLQAGGFIKRRVGGFLNTVGRVSSLRRDERERIAEKVRGGKYEKTLKDMKADELSEKVKKAIEKEDEAPPPAPPPPEPVA